MLTCEPNTVPGSRIHRCQVGDVNLPRYGSLPSASRQLEFHSLTPAAGQRKHVSAMTHADVHTTTQPLLPPRQICAQQTMAFARASDAVKKRFPERKKP